MKYVLPFFAAILAAAIQSACVGPDGPKMDNDRIHGSMGVGVSNVNTSRIVPERPYTAEPASGPAAPSAPNGPVLIPGSN